MEPQTDTSRCYWCGAQFRLEKGTTPEDGIYAEEVGEFWSQTLQDSVLGHPDCLPNGFETVFMDQDPEWKLA